MELQADEVTLATKLLNVLRVASQQDASQVPTHLLLDLPSDILADVLHRAMPWRCRLVCRAFRTHIDAGRTSVHLTSLHTNASLDCELRALLARLPGLKQLVASDSMNDMQAETVQQTSRNCTRSSRELNFLSACPQLVSLRLDHNEWLEDLSGVTMCTALESLCVQRCSKLRSVPALTACSRLTSLSLSGLYGYHDLDVLAECTQLQSLSVDGLYCCKVPLLAACTQLTSVTWHIGITDFTPLSLCPCLVSLRCTDSVDLTLLAACRELTSLDLSSRHNITGFATLSAFTNLQRLSLACSEIPDFTSTVEKCTALTWLDVSRLSESYRAYPTHIYFVTPLVHLVHLNLGGLPLLASITPLTSCPKLQSLELSHCEAIAQLPLLPSISQQLTAMCIDSGDAEDIKVVTGFSQLVQLQLDCWAELSDLKPLAACRRLASLHVRHCVGLVDPLPIASCALLTSFSFYRSSMLPDISFVAALPLLQQLNLAYTGIADISPVSALPLLQQLDLAYTRVADITPVGCCPLLADLDLSQCQLLLDIAPLAACGKLQRLDLRYCSRSITDLSVLLRLPMLRSVLVDRSFDTDHLGGRIRFRISKG